MMIEITTTTLSALDQAGPSGENLDIHTKLGKSNFPLNKTSTRQLFKGRVSQTIFILTIYDGKI